MTTRPQSGQPRPNALPTLPTDAAVLGQHIVYESPHFYIGAVMAFYLLATCVSSMLATHRTVRWFGALSLATFLAAYAIHAATLVSVWCFFAAVLSFIVYGYFRGQRRQEGRHLSPPHGRDVPLARACNATSSISNPEEHQ